MKKALLLVLPALIAIMFISCQKELSDPNVTSGTGGTTGTGGSSSTGSSNITGNWKFISLSAVTQSSIQYSLAGTTFKTVTNSAYTSTNNAGTVTVTITSNSMSSNGLSYSVTDTAYVLNYENNVLVDTLSQVFSFSLPLIVLFLPTNRLARTLFTIPARGSTPLALQDRVPG